MTHNFDCYGDYKEANLGGRVNGVLVSMVPGKTLGYALFNCKKGEGYLSSQMLRFTKV